MTFLHLAADVADRSPPKELVAVMHPFDSPHTQSMVPEIRATG